MLTAAQRRSVLRRCLASALRASGYGEVGAGEVPTTQPSSEKLLTAIPLVVVLSIWLAVADIVGGPWWSWPLFAVAVVLILVVLAARLGGLAAFAIFGGWALTLAAQVAVDGHWQLTHALPLAVVLGFALLTRQIDVRNARDVALAVAAIPKAAPLVAPLVLVVLVLPSLTKDVWDVAAALNAGRLGALTIITSGLLFVLVVRQLRAELPQVLVARTAAVVDSPTRAADTREALRFRLRSQTFALAAAESDQFVTDVWPTDGAQYAEFIAASAHRRITEPLLARLALCVLFVAAAVSVYLYAIVSLVVDRTIVEQWTGERVPIATLDLPGLVVTLPGGPYLAISALLTCLAVATFLAFVLTEERFSVALGDALLRLPVDRLLALALPFLHLSEERIIEGDPLPDAFDVGNFGDDQERGPSAVDQPSGGAERTSSA